jgi:hypothetical protein
MRTRFFAVVMAACIPVAAFAQKGAPRGDPTTASSGANGPTAAPSSAAKAPTSRDFADLNPASLLISKRKKASLADSTVAQLKAIEKKINERNAPFFATYDSVRKLAVPIASVSSMGGSTPGFNDADKTRAAAAPSAAETAQSQASMRDLKGLMAAYRDRRGADAVEALMVVPDAQKKAATDLLTQQDGDLDKLIGPRP